MWDRTQLAPSLKMHSAGFDAHQLFSEFTLADDDFEAPASHLNQATESSVTLEGNALSSLRFRCCSKCHLDEAEAHQCTYQPGKFSVIVETMDTLIFKLHSSQLLLWTGQHV